MKNLLIALALAVPAALLSGCASCPVCSSDSSPEIVACADCGVEEGSEGCCDPEAERCDDCGMIKGSALCCK